MWDIKFHILQITHLIYLVSSNLNKTIKEYILFQIHNLTKLDGNRLLKKSINNYVNNS
jgi:hypothetical protein